MDDPPDCRLAVALCDAYKIYCASALIGIRCLAAQVEAAGSVAIEYKDVISVIVSNVRHVAYCGPISEIA